MRAEIERIVDDRHEEIGGRDDRLALVDPVDRGVVGGLDADERVPAAPARHRALARICCEHAGRDLAAAAAAMGRTESSAMRRTLLGAFMDVAG